MIRKQNRRRMAAITLTSHGAPQSPHQQQHHLHGPVVEEIPALLRLYKDGHVDRLPLVPNVPASSTPAVSSADVPLQAPASAALWARLYAPTHLAPVFLPILLYFHGGGFCVGSPSWQCYHRFLSALSCRARCAIVSVAYRLAPEHRLPAAFDDGIAAATWIISDRRRLPPWWASRCDFSRLYLAGDSAGATIAYHVARRLGSLPEEQRSRFRGAVLIQPFIGGEERSASERSLRPAAGSALTLATADAYWRMALPAGASREHEWCGMAGEGEVGVGRVMVCAAEMDILRDRTAELCARLRRAGKKVEEVLHGGVEHAFQVLGGSRAAQRRAEEMMEQIGSFVRRPIIEGQ